MFLGGDAASPSVEVVVGGQARDAELGENGYRLAIEGGRHQLQELLLHLHGGATDTLNLQIPSPGRDLPAG
jgi:hypothetical protein